MPPEIPFNITTEQNLIKNKMKAHALKINNYNHIAQIQ